jgi:hypothetical protein
MYSKMHHLCLAYVDMFAQEKYIIMFIQLDEAQVEEAREVNK